MVAAATADKLAMQRVNQLIMDGKRSLRDELAFFLDKLQHPATQLSPPSMQMQYALLKLRFNALLDQLDIFADVFTQRGEEGTGIWMAGLDIAAKNALEVKLLKGKTPPLVTYLDRGHGAAIRRARTRLPGGHENPVAIIRIPRERMVGSGIASSLIHEVGHQGAVLLGLLTSLRNALQRQQNQHPQFGPALGYYERCISEIISDFWAIAHLGVGATAGLMAVVSLPHYFVFRVKMDAPHPFPWIRVMISLAFGEALYPDPQWQSMRSIWQRLYPVERQSQAQQELVSDLLRALPLFVDTVLQHAPPQLKGHTVPGLFPVKTRVPARLRANFQKWKGRLDIWKKASPTLVFAVLGQARADQAISANDESKLLKALFQHWALQRVTKV